MAQKLPLDNHVVRHIRNKHLIKNEADEVLGAFPDAFSLRDGEAYLSTCWLEHFPGDDLTRLCAVRDRLAMAREIKAADGLGILNVGLVIDAGERRSRKLRVLHEPTPEDPAYSAVRGMMREDLQLLELLASDACIEVTRVRLLAERARGANPL